MTERKAKPIIFTGPMVRAILDGRKTMTRRVLKPQPVDGERIERCGYPEDGWIVGRMRDSENAWRKQTCPYAVGDLLYVKETYIPRYPAAMYKADHDGIEAAGIAGMYGKWKSPRFMPRWASRITLEVTGVKLERVQDIGEEDAVAEGCTTTTYRDGRGVESAKLAFRRLWEEIHGPDSWDANPWIAAVSFRQVKGGE